MSHFVVAVFSDGTKTVDELLAPYQENNMGDCPKEYLAFYDVTDECKEEYETESRRWIRTPEGELWNPWDERFRKSGTFGSGGNSHFVPEDCVEVEIPHKETYSSFESFMNAYHSYEQNEEGRYGYWENPDRKWDWWVPGGRWSGQLLIKTELPNEDDKIPGFVRVDEAFVKDIAWDKMKEDNENYRRRKYQELQADLPSLREKYLELAKPDDKMTVDELLAKRAEWLYGIDINLTEDEHVAKGADRILTAFAVVMPDGKWYEEGSMGWWGCISDKDDNWEQEFKPRFLDTANPDWLLTMVDCHI